MSQIRLCFTINVSFFPKSYNKFGISSALCTKMIKVFFFHVLHVLGAKIYGDNQLLNSLNSINFSLLVLVLEINVPERECLPKLVFKLFFNFKYLTKIGPLRNLRENIFFPFKPRKVLEKFSDSILTSSVRNEISNYIMYCL